MGQRSFEAILRRTMSHYHPGFRVLPANIRQWVDDHEKELSERLGSAPLDCGLKALAAADFFLRYWLGDDWVETHADFKKPHPYFAFGDRDLGTLRYESRIVGLAELLLNMQDVPGFEHIVKKLPEDARNLEGAIAELQGASLLFVSRIPIEFLDPRPGRRYDVEAQVDGSRVACEMKSKVEGRVPSSKAVESRLKKPRTEQLPKDMPGVVMLRVPETWTKDEAGHEIIKRGITDTYKWSRRISAVVVHWESWEHSEGRSTLSVKCRVHSHDDPRFPLHSLSLKRATPSTWLRLIPIVCDPSQYTAEGYG